MQIEITDRQLALALQEWFIETDGNWSDVIGVVIKKNLQLKKRWKNLPRGNPRKGYAKQQESKENV